jgi:uncharacterized membrane protein
MSYNIHPLFVHFPIALLFLYSIIKILPFEKWFPKVAWRDIGRVLLVVGVLGAFTALLTGKTAEHLFHPNRQLVSDHIDFAVTSTCLYGALLAGEIISFVNARRFKYGKNWKFISPVLVFLEQVLCNRILSAIIALIGLIAISCTGILGGVMVYGPTADPLAGVLLHLLGITV